MATAARKRTGAFCVAAIAAATLVVGTPAPAGACAPTSRSDVFAAMSDGSMETITLRTFNLDIEMPKVAKIGTNAMVKVTVTRPAKEDPLGQGIPMERPHVEPAPDVIVGVGLHVGNVFLPAAAMTNDKGVANVRITIQDYAPANKWVDMSVYAWKVLHEAPCATIQEDGYSARPRAFKTKN